MPYITDAQRAEIDPYVRPLMAYVASPIVGAGVINYIVTKIVSAWLGSSYGYERLNSAIGVLECAKLELYRRVAAPYEDHKRAVNGDVFPFPPDYTAPGPFADPVLVPAQVPEQKRYPEPWGTVNRCQAPGCARIKDHPGACVDTSGTKP